MPDVRGLRLPDRVMGRRNREPEPDRSFTRAGTAHISEAPDLSQDALRDDAADARAGAQKHRGRTGNMARSSREGGKADRGPTPLSAHHVRPGDDPRNRVLSRNRELLAAFL